MSNTERVSFALPTPQAAPLRDRVTNEQFAPPLRVGIPTEASSLHLRICHVAVPPAIVTKRDTLATANAAVQLVQVQGALRASGHTVHVSTHKRPLVRAPLRGAEVAVNSVPKQPQRPYGLERRGVDAAPLFKREPLMQESTCICRFRQGFVPQARHRFTQREVYAVKRGRRVPLYTP